MKGVFTPQKARKLQIEKTTLAPQCERVSTELKEKCLFSLFETYLSGCERARQNRSPAHNTFDDQNHWLPATTGDFRSSRSWMEVLAVTTLLLLTAPIEKKKKNLTIVK